MNYKPPDKFEHVANLFGWLKSFILNRCMHINLQPIAANKYVHSKSREQAFLKMCFWYLCLRFSWMSVQVSDSSNFFSLSDSMLLNILWLAVTKNEIRMQNSCRLDQWSNEKITTAYWKTIIFLFRITDEESKIPAL